ncbi:Protein of uncharacterised function (DUF1161) [Kluyvera cryocrescens]|uniref:Protein of uncharacterized function (DUF1161) n=1 Tax=Kluyvera cryocrescens TaxID=580 RepID=A0A485CRH2_KLUCR|nr:Protein of uncharacterised function (DUF1161) [Kluyvera cryocrescens]
MRSSRWLLALLLAGAMPALAAVPDSCERFRERHSAKKSSTTGSLKAPSLLISFLTIRPISPGAQVVGHCANDTFKILYTRTDSAQ